jgi:hypothetical protein
VQHAPCAEAFHGVADTTQGIFFTHHYMNEGLKKSYNHFRFFAVQQFALFLEQARTAVTQEFLSR